MILCRVSLDGSQVICHMPPAKTYCAEGNFENIKNSIANHKSLDQDNTALLAVRQPLWISLLSIITKTC